MVGSPETESVVDKETSHHSDISETCTITVYAVYDQNF